MILSLGLSMVLSGFAFLAFTENDLSIDSPFPGVRIWATYSLPWNVDRHHPLLPDHGGYVFLPAPMQVGAGDTSCRLDPEAAILQGINIDLVIRSVSVSVPLCGRRRG